MNKSQSSFYWLNNKQMLKMVTQMEKMPLHKKEFSIKEIVYFPHV